MKKSKILIPAFAVLALSVGASVTGTVAWFTANRTSSFTTTFGVADIDGSLSVELTGNDRAGTKLNTSKNIEVDGKLTHGSYDAQAKSNAGQLYVANLSNDTDGENKYTVDSYTSLGILPEKSEATGSEKSKWQAGVDATDNKNVWYGVSFSATFTLEAGGIRGNNYLFVDYEKCTVTNTGESNANDGFTVAIMDVDAANPIVIGADANKKHVKGVNKQDTEDFANYYTFASTTVTKAQDEMATADIKKHKGYIGQFPTEDGVGTKKGKITVTFVAWFEGENSNVISEKASKLNDISANLSFYARRSNVD